ncbi:MAG TPA: glycosyltransferase family 39 protein [Streptosporangiaceae bacterium]
MAATAPAASGAAEEPARGSAPVLARRPVAAIAAALGLVLLALSARYGYHRDELYFRVAARHLAWGYPDQPPLLPLLYRVLTWLFGDSLVMLRLPAAVSSAAGVVVAALTARDMGGTRRAQLWTAGAYAVCPFVIAVGHTLYTATIDLFVSTLLVWLVIRWVRIRDRWSPLWIGATAAVAVNVKYVVVLLLGGILAGVLISGPRELLRRPLTAAGTAIAVAGALPGLWWQASHGWPQLDMAHQISGGDDFGGRPGFIPFLLLITGVVLSWLWLYGLWRLLRSVELAPFRFLAYAYLLLVVVFIVTGGKPYYVAALWAALWAAGAVEVERRGAPRGAGWTLAAPTYAITGISAAALTLPIYPVGTLASTPQPAINGDAAETVGWPAFTAEVARVYRALPNGERAQAILLMSNYGEAGALDRYGKAFGLPRPYSGHNGYWYFGRPPDTGGPTIVVGPDAAAGPAYLHRFWTDVTIAGRIDNGAGLDNEEQGKPIWVCRGQRAPWPALWPQLRHLS